MPEVFKQFINEVLTRVPGELLLFIILSGIIAWLKWIWSTLRRAISHRSFKKVFGDDVFSQFHVIPGNLHLRQDLVDNKGNKVDFPYYKPQRHNPTTIGLFKTSIPVPYNETKSAKYIIEAFKDEINKSPILTHDEEVLSKVDLSFCSFGGLNNYKTMDVLSSDQNVLIEFDTPNIVVKNNPNTKFTADTINDYGTIVKLHPRQFPNRVWLAIAGIDESGTSGASWYLAKNWKKLAKKFSDKGFAIVIKVRRDQDESAEIVYEHSF